MDLESGISPKAFKGVTHEGMPPTSKQMLDHTGHDN